MMNLQKIATSVLSIAYLDAGPKDGPVAILLHGWPDDVHAWDRVAPALQQAGYRTIIPYLRGFGQTAFLSAHTVRDASGVALASDVIELADGLGIDRFTIIGHDWGARAAYTLAALFPERIVHVIALALPYQPGGRFAVPDFEQARLFWYQWFMISDAGADAVRKDPVGFARIQWDTWSPGGWFTEEDFRHAAASFTNEDWVAITLNGYRRRFTWAPSDERYQSLQAKLGTIEHIRINTLLLQGDADTCDPPAGSEGQEPYFLNGFQRILIAGAGHFVMRECPDEVAARIIRFLGNAD